MLNSPLGPGEQRGLIGDTQAHQDTLTTIPPTQNPPQPHQLPSASPTKPDDDEARIEARREEALLNYENETGVVDYPDSAVEDHDYLPSGQGSPQAVAKPESEDEETPMDEDVNITSPTQQINPSLTQQINPAIKNLFTKWKRESHEHKVTRDNLHILNKFSQIPKGLEITDPQPRYPLPHDLQDRWEKTLAETSGKLLSILLEFHERELSKVNSNLEALTAEIESPEVLEELNKISSSKLSKPRKRSPSTPIPGPHPKITKPLQSKARPQQKQKPFTPGANQSDTTRPKPKIPSGYQTHRSNHPNSYSRYHNPHLNTPTNRFRSPPTTPNNPQAHNSLMNVPLNHFQNFPHRY